MSAFGGKTDITYAIALFACGRKGTNGLAAPMLHGGAIDPGTAPRSSRILRTTTTDRGLPPQGGGKSGARQIFTVLPAFAACLKNFLGVARSVRIRGPAGGESRI